jgi:hypothetical protein
MMETYPNENIELTYYLSGYGTAPKEEREKFEDEIV